MVEVACRRVLEDQQKKMGRKREATFWRKQHSDPIGLVDLLILCSSLFYLDHRSIVMSVHEVTYISLVDMGIEPNLARAAATRFHSVEPAVNWCFGDGMSVRSFSSSLLRSDPQPVEARVGPQSCAIAQTV